MKVNLPKANGIKFRFLSVGVVNTIVDFAILFVLVWLGIPKVIANIFSTTAAFLTSFTLNKRFTFQSKETNIAKEMSKFIAVTLFSIWVVQSLVIYLATPVFAYLFHNNELSLLFAKIAAVSAGMICNYFTYSRFVFKKH